MEKQIKTIEKQVKKEIDAITKQNERLVALTNKGDHKDINTEIFDTSVKEKGDEIKESTGEINQNGLKYCFKGNTF